MNTLLSLIASIALPLTSAGAPGPLPAEHPTAVAATYVNGKQITVYLGPYGAPSIAFGLGGDLWYGTPLVRLAPHGHGYFTRYPIPRGDVNAIALGADGKTMWFVPYGDHYVGKVDVSGNVTLFVQDVKYMYHSAAIVAGPDGRMWFPVAHRRLPGYIGAITSDGRLQRYPVGISPEAVAKGPNAMLWFGEQNAIGMIASNGLVTTYTVQSQVRSIAQGSDGNMWFCLGGVSSSFSAIGRIAPDGSGLTYFALPSQSSCGGLTLAADGNLYTPLSQSGTGAFLAIAPTGAMTTYPIPQLGQYGWILSGITAGTDGRSVYVVSQYAGDVVRLSIGKP